MGSNSDSHTFIGPILFLTNLFLNMTLMFLSMVFLIWYMLILTTINELEPVDIVALVVGLVVMLANLSVVIGVLSYRRWTKKSLTAGLVLIIIGSIGNLALFIYSFQVGVQWVIFVVLIVNGITAVRIREAIQSNFD